MPMSGDELPDEPVSTLTDTGDSPVYKPSVIRTRVIPGLAMVMVVGLLGLLAYSLFGPKTGRPEGRINSSGAIVSENGRAAPDFSAPLLNGDQFRLADYRGKIVVLNFWASWCPPCREETPLLTTVSTAARRRCRAGRRGCLG